MRTVFNEGDRVQVRPERDETLLLLGVRTRPGTVTYVTEDGHVIVALDDEHGNEGGGQSVPYPPSDLTTCAADLRNGRHGER